MTVIYTHHIYLRSAVESNVTYAVIVLSLYLFWTRICVLQGIVVHIWNFNEDT